MKFSATLEGRSILTKNTQPPCFDWWKELEARCVGLVTPYSHSDLIDFAGNWPTCACGHQCASIPRFMDGMPRDTELSDLGMDFYHAVVNERWGVAQDVLIKIERRSQELIDAQRDHGLR